MQNSASYSVTDISIITFIGQNTNTFKKENKINDHSDSMFSKSQSEIFIVQKRNLHNLKKDKTRLENKAD